MAGRERVPRLPRADCWRGRKRRNHSMGQRRDREFPHQVLSRTRRAEVGPGGGRIWCQKKSCQTPGCQKWRENNRARVGWCVQQKKFVTSFFPSRVRVRFVFRRFRVVTERNVRVRGQPVLPSW